MPQADATQTPAADNLVEKAALVEEAFANSERQFVGCISGEVVTNIENAGSLSQARQFTFSGPLDYAPPPTDPSLME